MANPVRKFGMDLKALLNNSFFSFNPSSKDRVFSNGVKRIGIPKALLYYKYYLFWEAFLEGLECEVVTSGETTQKILQDGIKHSIDESCLPVKVFCGHVLKLIERGVNYLFIPRIESVEKKHFVCTKFLGLPDIVRNCIPLTPEMSRAILSPNIDFNRRLLYQSMFSVGWRLTKNPFKIHIAYWRAKKKQQNFEKMLTLTKTPQEITELIKTGEIKKSESKGDVNGVNIALIGHPYNIHDSFINLRIIEKLQDLGVNVLTHEMVPHGVSCKLSSEASSDLYWTYAKEILGASIYFMKEGVNGIIFIISFPCGPDSLTVEYAIRHIKDQVPTFSLVIDEHQAEAGIITRLESFVDLVRMRKKR